MNKELLFQLYSIHSPSGREKKMRKFLRRQAEECGAQSIVTDAWGNLLITKGVSDTYPCLAAHMDQVQMNHSKDFTVVQIGDDVLGWSSKSHAQQGLGADDKNGIFICLECLRKYDAIKVAFFVEEETGCGGSRNVGLDFFSDGRFIVQPDRRGGRDLITSMFGGDVCSDDFVRAIGADQFGYTPEHGSITDVGELVERGVGISCLNLSCGYYDAHTDRETTRLSELQNCLDFVQHIIENVTDVYPFVQESCYEYPLYGRSRSMHRDYWGRNNEADDYTMMEWIVEQDPDISFEEIKNEWAMNFYTRSVVELRAIYNDVKSYMFPDEDYWGEDAGENLSTDSARKVSDLKPNKKKK